MVLLFIVITLAAYFAITAGFEKIDELAFARRNRKAQAEALARYFPVGA